MSFLTDFADQAVMLPLATAVALVLALSRWWRGCAAWVATVVAVLGTMAVLKYAFFACAPVLGQTGIRSPSGHTAASAAIIGGGLVLFLRGRIPTALLVLLPIAVAVLFAVTRLAVHAHTVPEVIAGGIVGLAGAAALPILAGPRPPSPVWPAALAACVILVGLHGVRLHAETALHSLRLFTWLPLPTACLAAPTSGRRVDLQTRADPVSNVRPSG